MRSSRAILSFGGIGFLPGPSGTYASLATAAIVVALSSVGPPALAPAVLAAVGFGCLATLLLGNGLAAPPGPAAPPGLTTGAPACHGADPSWVVTDEVAGQGVALLLAGFSPARGLVTTAAAFVLFRVFDVWKPGPVGAAERLPGGLGILADDLLAGILSGALTLGLGAVLP